MPNLFFPEEHLQIVAVSLPAVRVMDVKINVTILPEQYQRCLREDVVCCQVRGIIRVKTCMLTVYSSRMKRTEMC